MWKNFNRKIMKNTKILKVNISLGFYIIFIASNKQKKLTIFDKKYHIINFL